MDRGPDGNREATMLLMVIYRPEHTDVAYLDHLDSSLKRLYVNKGCHISGLEVTLISPE